MAAHGPEVTRVVSSAPTRSANSSRAASLLGEAMLEQDPRMLDGEVARAATLPQTNLRGVGHRARLLARIEPAGAAERRRRTRRRDGEASSGRAAGLEMVQSRDGDPLRRSHRPVGTDLRVRWPRS